MGSHIYKKSGNAWNARFFYDSMPDSFGHVAKRRNAETFREFLGLRFVFDEPQLLSKIIIHTGIKSHPADKIHHAKLEASLSSIPKGPGKPECRQNKLLGYFEDGEIEISEIQSVLKEQKIHCLNIIITNKQETWVIVREVAVFTRPSKGNSAFTRPLK